MNRADRTASGQPATTRRSTWGERAIVLGGFAIAVLHGPPLRSCSIPAWRRSVRRGRSRSPGPCCPPSHSLSGAASARRDWSAFRRYRLSGNGDLIDWSTKSGAYAYLRVAEEHERLMRGD